MALAPLPGPIAKRLSNSHLAPAPISYPQESKMCHSIFYKIEMLNLSMFESEEKEVASKIYLICIILTLHLAIIYYFY
jgi:hypothetical protein